MSIKHSSLAFDETFKEIDLDGHFDSGFEPDLKVIVNANYLKTPFMHMAASDVIEVKGSITVSF